MCISVAASGEPSASKKEERVRHRSTQITANQQRESHCLISSPMGEISVHQRKSVSKKERLTSGSFLRGFPSKTTEAQFQLEAIARQIHAFDTLRALVLDQPASHLLSTLAAHPDGQSVLNDFQGYLDSAFILEDTILTTNLEAAREAARQIRLRNLSGLLVVDFIDMENPAQRQLVHQTLQESFQKDRARTTIYPMSPLGLVEMTRQRLRDSLAQVVTAVCPCCRGQGAVMSPLVVAHDILRQLAWEAREFAHCRLTVTAHPEIIALVKQEGEDFFRELNAGRQILIHLTEDSHLSRDRFDIVRELHKGGEKV